MDAPGTQRSDRRVANGLLLLAVAQAAGLLVSGDLRWAVALLPAAAAAIVVFARPMGNRMLAFGLLLMAGLLALALWSFPVFFRMLDVLVAIILLGAGILKHKGKW